MPDRRREYNRSERSEPRPEPDTVLLHGTAVRCKREFGGSVWSAVIDVVRVNCLVIGASSLPRHRLNLCLDWHHGLATLDWMYLRVSCKKRSWRASQGVRIARPRVALTFGFGRPLRPGQEGLSFEAKRAQFACCPCPTHHHV